MADLGKQGKTIVFSAHNLYQVERLCDRVLIMNSGREVACGTMSEIKKRCGAVEYVLEFGVDEEPDFEYVRKNGHFMARTNDLEEFNRITGWAGKHGGKIFDIKTVEPSLEEIFLKLMG